MQFKTFWFRFTQGETNAGYSEVAKWEGISIPNLIDQELNNWLKEHPGTRIVQMVQSCTEHNKQYVVQIALLYENVG